jgi:alanine-glyoxylate transaminase/serine-glyoxylate transaminase/serine-pyruvate transaminase
VTTIRSAAGDIIDPEKVEIILKGGAFKLMTFTHVDTSTAVMVDPRVMGKLGKKYGVLTVLDGVCSVAGEEIRQEKWGIDVVFTASQKAIGVPPGLALLAVSPKAMAIWRKRKTPVGNYYADWNNWLPIMEAYEARKPAYFGTPPVNHICALNVSLEQILEEGMEARFERHKKISTACKKAVTALGMKQVPVKPKHAASTMTAPYYPDGVKGSDLLPKIKEAGVIVAGGLHRDIKNTYFRIGHMGAVKPGDILATIGAIETGLQACGYKFKQGAGITVAQRVLSGG